MTRGQLGRKPHNPSYVAPTIPIVGDSVQVLRSRQSAPALVARGFEMGLSRFVVGTVLGGLAIASAASCTDADPGEPAPLASHLLSPARGAGDAARWLQSASASPARRLDKGFAVLPAALAGGEKTSSSPHAPAPRFVSAATFGGFVLGTTAGEPMRVKTTGAPAIGVKRLASRDSAGRLSDGMVVYANATRGVDAVVFATEHGVEDLWRVHEPRSSWGYELDLPQGWRIRPAPNVNGLAEVRDERDVARLRVWANRAWDAEGDDVPVWVTAQDNRVTVHIGEAKAWPVLVDPEWTGTEVMVYPRTGASLTVLGSGKVLVAGGDDARLGVCELFDPETNTFSVTGSLLHPRRSHLATPQPDGTVVLLGGEDGSAEAAPVTHVEVYDSASGTFSSQGEVPPLVSPLLVSLRDGKVLLAGGFGTQLARLRDAYVYDPATGQAQKVGSVDRDIVGATASLLPSGKVLLAGGGTTQQTPQPLTAIFDPATGTFAQGPSLSRPRGAHAAVTLADGRVVVIGGMGPDWVGIATTEVVDPKGGFSAAGPTLKNTALWGSTVLLPDGRILVASGISNTGAYLDDTEVLDVHTRTTVPGPRLTRARPGASAVLLPDGRPLLVGPGVAAEWMSVPWELEDRSVLATGRSAHTATRISSGDIILAGNTAGSPEVEAFDPITGRVRSAGQLLAHRYAHTATLLDEDKILLIGGGGWAIDTTEIFDPRAGASTFAGNLRRGRWYHMATPLPDGRVLIAGGCESPEIEIWEHGTQTTSVAGALSQGRYAATATTFPDGRVLIAGGAAATSWEVLASTEWFDPETGDTTQGPSLTAPRYGHEAVLTDSGDLIVIGYAGTLDVLDAGAGAFRSVDANVSAFKPRATLLASGKILITGGETNSGAIAKSYLYDPKTETVETLPNLSTRRVEHSATLLEDGRVLLAGGSLSWNTAYENRVTLELFDPGAKSFSRLDAPSDFRPNRTATLLPSGSLLLAGGTAAGTAYCELWRPSTRDTVPTDTMTTARTGHTATTLDTGSVLMIGGQYWEEPTTTAEVFHLPEEQFQPVGEMQIARTDHTATRLPTGEVLVVGGADDPTCEIFSPTTATFRATGSLHRARSRHGAVLTPEGHVLVAGGVTPDGQPVLEIESFDPQRAVFDLLEGRALVGGITRGAWDRVGAALFAGPATGYATDVYTSNLRGLSGLPSTPAAAFSLLSGGASVCGDQSGLAGITSCVAATADRSDGIVLFLAPGGSPGSVAARLRSGQVWLNSQAIPNGAVSLVARSAPEDSLRPTIASIPDRVQIGVPATLQGARFTSPASRQGHPTPPMPGIVPLVTFVPAQEGSPVVFALRQWADDTIEFVPAPTTFHGPGWLHVMVDGVPSEGRFVLLEPRSLGTACETDGECASGFCVEGACCDSRCDEACASCLAARKGSGADGHCGPVTAGQDPKKQCPDQPAATCGTSGTCDGHGSCAVYADGTPCASSRLCRAGTCTPTVGEPCDSSVQCAPGQICSAAAVCEQQSPSALASDPGACSVRSPPPRNSRAWLWIAALALGTARFRRRLRRNDRTAQQERFEP